MKKFLLIAMVVLIGCSAAGCTWETLSEGVSQTADGWAWDGCHPGYPVCGNVYVNEDGFGGGFDGDFP
jgi:hypothetical protein